MADYRVVLEPEDTFIGTLNEDFAIESMAGDIFQLGNASWQITQVVAGTVRVRDAHGAPPTIPFWLGEAPATKRRALAAPCPSCGTRPTCSSLRNPEPGSRSTAAANMAPTG